MQKHVFNAACDTAIAKAQAVCNSRAGEYMDSWSLSNLATPFLGNLIREFPSTIANSCDEARRQRLIIMASMIDIKLSRLGGPWKEDTALDLINYIAAYATLRGEFKV